MPSQLVNNDKVSFVVAKAFRFYDTDYEIGDDFPEEVTNRIETLVRSRYIIPVIESIDDKPRHWHREVRLRDEVMSHLNRSLVQLVFPNADEGQPELPFDDSFNPSDHNVVEVKDHLAKHPEDRDRVLKAEADGKARKGLLEDES